MTQTLTDGRQISTATETVQGVVIRATDAEVLAQTDTTKYIVPAQLHLVPGTGTVHYNQNVNNSTGQTYQFTFLATGMYLVNFALSQSGSGGGGIGPVDIDGVTLPIKDGDDTQASTRLAYDMSPNINIGAGDPYNFITQVFAVEGQTISFVVGEAGDATGGTIKITSR